MDNSPNDLKYTNLNIETKISIVRNMIRFYEIQIKCTKDKFIITGYSVSLHREEENLKEYKQKYPELFI